MKRRDMVGAAGLIGMGLVGGTVIAGPSTTKPASKPPTTAVMVLSLMTGSGSTWRLGTQNAPVIGKAMVLRVHSVQAAPDIELMADTIFNVDQLGQTACAMATARRNNTSSDYCFNAISDGLVAVKVALQNTSTKSSWNVTCAINSKQSTRVSRGEYRLVAHLDSTPAFLLEQACGLNKDKPLPEGVFGVMGLTASLA